VVKNEMNRLMVVCGKNSSFFFGNFLFSVERGTFACLRQARSRLQAVLWKNFGGRRTAQKTIYRLLWAPKRCFSERPCPLRLLIPHLRDKVIHMSNAELLIEEIKTLPSNCVAQVLDFVEFIKQKEANKAKFSYLPKEDALSMTSDVIEEYRPALEELAK
jgi:hypothetical protein